MYVCMRVQEGCMCEARVCWGTGVLLTLRYIHTNIQQTFLPWIWVLWTHLAHTAFLRTWPVNWQWTVGCRIRRPNSAQVRPDFSRARVHLLVSSTGSKQYERWRTLTFMNRRIGNEGEERENSGCRYRWKQKHHKPATSKLQVHCKNLFWFHEMLVVVKIQRGNLTSHCHFFLYCEVLPLDLICFLHRQISWMLMHY